MRRNSASKVIRRFLSLFFLIGVPSFSETTAENLAPPFQETFDAALLSPHWTVDVSEGNAIKARNGYLEISAGQNTYAHIELPLNVDLIRAGCTLKPGSEEDRWAASLFVYWDPLNWCQFYPVKNETGTVGVWYAYKGGGLYRSAEMVEGELNDHLVVPTYNPQWHRLAIELGEDCIRYQGSADGKLWVTLKLIERPVPWRGKAPKLFIVGKGSGTKPGTTEPGAPDMDNDDVAKGAPMVSRIREVFIDRTPADHIRMTSLEKRQKELWGIDWLGEQEIAAEGDPTYESVSRHFPELKFPREVIGLKDHPRDIGVAFDGSLQLNGFHTGNHLDNNAPAGIYEVGTPPVRLGWEVGSCRKRLLNGYMPIIVCDYEHDGLEFEQTVFGHSDGLSVDNPMSAYSRMTVSNPGPKRQTVDLYFRLHPTEAAQSWKLNLEPGGKRSVYIKVPWSADASQLSKVDEGEYRTRLGEVVKYWEDLLSQGIKINAPEQRVSDAYRAWLAYNFLNVDKQNDHYLTPDGSGFYDELYGYAACHYMRALDLMSYHEDARKYLHANLSLVRDDGLFFTNFGLPDTAALLVALSDHFQMTGDKQWLRSVASAMIQMCDWVVKRRAEDRGKAPELVKGMIYFRPYADYPQPAFNYFTDTYLCVAMEATAKVLLEIGLSEEANRISADATDYRKDILRSMDAAVFEHEGIKVLPFMPMTQELL